MITLRNKNGQFIKGNTSYWLGKNRSPLSLEIKTKISIAHKGKHISLKTEFKKGHIMTEETRAKISNSHKGRKKPPFTETHRRNLSISHTGKKHSQEWKEKMRIIMTGRKHSEESKQKMSIFNKNNPRPELWESYSKLRKGKNNPNWRGGKVRGKHTGTKYKKWRNAVFQQDDFTCQNCRKRGDYLEAHHKKSWKKYPKLRYIIKNGITFCKYPCHKLANEIQRKQEKNL